MGIDLEFLTTSGFDFSLKDSDYVETSYTLFANHNI